MPILLEQAERLDEPVAITPRRIECPGPHPRLPQHPCRGILAFDYDELLRPGGYIKLRCPRCHQLWLLSCR